MPSLPATQAVSVSTQATVKSGRSVPASCRVQLRPPSVVWKIRPSSPTIQPDCASAKQVAKSPWRISSGVIAAADAAAAAAARHRGAAASGALIDGLLRRPSRARFALSTAVRTRTRAGSARCHGRAARRAAHELDPHVVTVAQRAELPRGSAVDGRVVEDEAEGVAGELHARLHEDGTLPVVVDGELRRHAPPVVRGVDEQRVQELIVGQPEEARLEDARSPLELRAVRPAAPRQDGHEPLGILDRHVAEGHRQDQVARRVEDVAIEELRREEDGLGGVDPADEAVVIEAERQVEGVALERRALDRRLAAEEVGEARIDERVEPALGVVLGEQAIVARGARAGARIEGVAGALAVEGLALEPRRLAAHDRVEGGNGEGERAARDRHVGIFLAEDDGIGEARDALWNASPHAGDVEVGVVAGERDGDVAQVEHEACAAAPVVPRRSGDRLPDLLQRRTETARLPGRARRDPGERRHRVARGEKALDERLVERADRAELVAPAYHVERHALLVEGDEDAAEAQIERVDVVEQAEDVRLAPREHLAADAEEDRPLPDVGVRHEDAVPVSGDALEQADALADVARVEGGPHAEGRFGAKGLERRSRVGELLRPVVVNALVLAAVLDRVLEVVEVEPAEEAGEPPAFAREAAEVVVELELEEVAVLTEVPRARLGERQRVGGATLGLRPDARVGVRAHPEAYLTPIVDGEGVRRADRNEAGSRGERDQQPSSTLHACVRHLRPPVSQGEASAVSARVYKKAL